VPRGRHPSPPRQCHQKSWCRFQRERKLPACARQSPRGCSCGCSGAASVSTAAHPRACVAATARRGHHSRAATADVGTPPRRREVLPPPPQPSRPHCLCTGGGEKAVDGGGGGERPPTPTATRRLSASWRCAPLSPKAPAARRRHESRQGPITAPLSAVLPCGRCRLATTRSARVFGAAPGLRDRRDGGGGGVRHPLGSRQPSANLSRRVPAVKAATNNARCRRPATFHCAHSCM